MIAPLFAITLTTLTWVPIPQPKVTQLDLSAKANQELDKEFHSKTYPGNTLKSLPQGKQKLGGVEFNVGKKLIQTKSTIIRDKPAKVEGIAVGHRFDKLHLLHATSHDVANGVTIGHYVINYVDKTTVKIPLIYGRNVSDWWHAPNDKGLTQGAIAWKGTNKAVKQFKRVLCLYRVTWTNPQPGKVVSTIDLVSHAGRCGPFCVAITTERN